MAELGWAGSGLPRSVSPPKRALETQVVVKLRGPGAHFWPNGPRSGFGPAKHDDPRSTLERERPAQAPQTHPSSGATEADVLCSHRIQSETTMQMFIVLSVSMPPRLMLCAFPASALRFGIHAQGKMSFHI